MPATLAQHRSLTNYGLHSDLSRVEGRHNLKAGVNVTQTKLSEAFSLGVTDPGYNAPCEDQSRGDLVAFRRTEEAPRNAPRRGSNPIQGFLPGSAAVRPDARRRSRYRFQGRATISQVAWFGQDTITFGN